MEKIINSLETIVKYSKNLNIITETLEFLHKRLKDTFIKNDIS